MTGADLLRATVAILEVAGHPARPGLAGMVVVGGTPVIRVQSGRLILIATGTARARTVEPREEPEQIAAEVLRRVGASLPIIAA